MKMDYLISSDQPVLPDEPYAGRGVRRIHKYRAGQVQEALPAQTKGQCACECAFMREKDMKE